PVRSRPWLAGVAPFLPDDRRTGPPPSVPPGRGPRTLPFESHSGHRSLPSNPYHTSHTNNAACVSPSCQIKPAGRARPCDEGLTYLSVAGLQPHVKLILPQIPPNRQGQNVRQILTLLVRAV